MQLSLQEIQGLLTLIEYRHLEFIGMTLGRDILTPEDEALLLLYGIDVQTMPQTGIADDMFRLGILAAALGATQYQAASVKDLQNFLQGNQFRQLSGSEVRLLQLAKRQLYSNIKGLGNRVSSDFSTVLVDIDKRQRNQYEALIRRETTAAVYHNSGRQELARALRNATKDWARDFDRIAATTLHDIYDQGRAAHIEEKYGANAKVYKMVLAGACKHCQRLYLTGAIGSEPIVFDLAKLRQNGTNYGRKAAQYLPVVGPTHPWCRCTLFPKPANTEWDADTQSFRPKKPTKRYGGTITIT